ncbi:MAG: sensor histidine kinase [Bacillota bacterium]
MSTSEESHISRFFSTIKLPLIFILMIIISLLGAMLSLYIVTGKVKQDNIIKINIARVMVSETIKTVETVYEAIGDKHNRSRIGADLARIRGSLVVIDTNGMVVYSSREDNNSFAQPSIPAVVYSDAASYSTGDYVDLKSALHYDAEFEKKNKGIIKCAFPVIINGVQKANAIFELPAESIMNTGSKALKTLAPIFAAISIVLLFSLFLILKIHYGYSCPLKKLGIVLDQLSRGQFYGAFDSTEQGVNQTNSFCAPDQKHVEIKSSMFQQSEEVEYLFSCYKRIREELDYSIERRNELESSRRELVATISHELRTPISSIKMYSEGLRDGIADDPETFKKYVDIIIKKSDSLSKLIDDLFNHSQQAVAKMKINKVEIYSGEMLRNIISPIKLQFMGGKINFFAVEPYPNILVFADPLRIEQLLTNLIFNSRKHVKNGGTISFQACYRDNCLELIVTDDGSGINPKDMPFIFERFYQGEESRLYDYEGAGLGLSICKYIVEQHGGEIFVESKLNIGTRFTVRIPKL